MYLIFLLNHNAGSNTIEYVLAVAAIIAAFAASYAAFMNRKMVSAMVRQLNLESRPYITAFDVESNFSDNNRFLQINVKLRNWGKIPAENVSFKSQPVIKKMVCK